MDKKWCKAAAMAEDGLDVRAGALASDPPEYSAIMTDDIKTVHGLVFWLQTIATDGDKMVDQDAISEVCAAAAKRLQSLQDSLRSEVARIEKLQPFFTEVSRAVDEARKPQH